jgi:ABC-2 type transport system permease protein
VAGAFTNTVFGFLRCYVLLAVAREAAGGRPGGYDPRQLATYVWVGQGLLSVIGLWGWSELADRIRTGEVAADLLRPVHPVIGYLAPNYGRAMHAMLTRFLPPLAAGLIFFPLYTPARWYTIPLFALSIVLAVTAGFGCVFLVNATGYWLHNARGPMIMWSLAGTLLAGLYFPLRLLPSWLYLTVWLGTPVPGLLQSPLDVLVERDPPARQLLLVVVQAVWAVIMLALCVLVQRRAERRMVMQGG